MAGRLPAGPTRRSPGARPPARRSAPRHRGARGRFAGPGRRRPSRSGTLLLSHGHRWTGRDTMRYARAAPAAHARTGGASMTRILQGAVAALTLALAAAA